MHSALFVGLLRAKMMGLSFRFPMAARTSSVNRGPAPATPVQGSARIRRVDGGSGERREQDCRGSVRVRSESTGSARIRRRVEGGGSARLRRRE